MQRPQPLQGEQDETKRAEILSQTKIELNKLIKLSIEVERTTPLIFEDENVVQHL